LKRSVRRATAVLARPIESVNRRRSTRAPSSVSAPSKPTKAASRKRAGVRRSARVEIQKSPTLERRRIKSTYPATVAAANSSSATYNDAPAVAACAKATKA
jgi:hypothetical protein